MDQLPGQRGYTRISRMVLLALVVAAGYLGVTFWPPARAAYRIKNDAKRLANRTLQADGSRESHIRRFLEVMNDREGLILTGAELNVDNSDPDVAHVTVHVELPYEYPFIGKKDLWKTTIEVTAERSRGF